MKFLLIAACLVLYVASSCGQRCNGLPRETQDCQGGKHEGVSQLRGCRPSPNPEMWWYNRQTNDCLKMNYRGCGGNRNRYCTKAACMEKCRRRN
ncbi:hypothetical protein KR054_012171 [Drosophila jambulina]|nr:hypothetical protein KR054_012171 [Drosophila jambulina]